MAAFGIAPLAPDASDLPRRVVTELLPVPDLDTQREALAGVEDVWHQTTDTRRGDTMASVLKRLGVTDQAAVDFARNDPVARLIVEGRVGKRVRAQVDGLGRLMSLTAALPSRDAATASTHFTRASIVATSAQRFASAMEPVPLTKGMRIGSGTIRSSLFEATDAASIPDAVAIQIAEIFASEIDFHRELRKGDTFRVVYESLMADDEPVAWNEGSGRVLAVEFVNKGETHQALWYQAAQGRGEYYDFKGESRRRAFLASPLEFSRVTSGFAMRMHPIHKTWRKHLGVDYAAPTGTPVRSVGDGVVEFAGQRGGYGNVVIVKHSQQRATLYAHLSRIAVRAGQNVHQGQHVGAVGATGWATGPHLHFEFQVRGEHQDPLIIARASETIPLPAHARADFAAVGAEQAARLGVAQSLALARGTGE